MGHTTKSQKNTARLGFSDSNDSKDPEDEVNDYLMRAIDARSIDRLRSEHCKSVLLSFKKANVERKVSSFGMFFFCSFSYRFFVCFFGVFVIYIQPTCNFFLCSQYISEPDRMLAKYLYCSIGIFIGMILIRIVAYPL